MAKTEMNTEVRAAYRTTLLGRFDERYLSRPHVDKVLWGILLAVLVTAGVQAAVQIRKVDSSAFRATGERRKTALGRWMPDAHALTAGENPYGPGHWFPTPPLVLICLVPFTKMPLALAGGLWAALKIAGVALAFTLLHRSLAKKGVVVPTGVWLMTAIFGTRAVFSDIQHANVNTFVLIWIALAWTLFMKGKDFWVGIFLVAAIVTKITPALLLLYFVYKRAWRVCLGGLVGIALFFFIVPGISLGFTRNWALLTSWYHMLVEPFAREGYAALEIANQSLYGVLVRLLSNAGILSIVHMPDQQAWASGMEEMARPATALGRLLRPAITLTALAALAWLCRAKTAKRQDPRLLLEFGLVLLAMLLLSERTWKHHATTLPLIYLGIWYALTCLPWNEKFRSWVVAGLGVQLVLLVGLSEGLVGDRVADMALDGGLFCWGLILCFVQSAMLVKALEAREPQPSAIG
ncbi:MAG TPA: glycosyltransferase family 87 protein [Phycisphaerae bacterium]|nr:glycosyltransferase family 87 protein [Phycisphaerae bacterium]